MRLHRYTDAERTLRRVVELAPGDIEGLGRLERVAGPAAQARRRPSRSSRSSPRSTPSAPASTTSAWPSTRPSSTATTTPSATRRAPSSSAPTTPTATRSSARCTAQRQDTERAIAEFRQAIAKNERLFPVYLELAELLLARGEVDEADRLFRRVVRASPDEELVLQAARLSMQVNLGRGTLESLERELLPVALDNPRTPALPAPAGRALRRHDLPARASRARAADAAQAAEARAQLRKLGERAVKPLLDALSDPRDSQQVVAITLLMHVANQGAAPALFAYATGDAESSLRARAMLALGGLEDEKTLPRLSQWLTPDGQVRSDESDPVVLAAAYSAARLRSPAARGLLSALLESEAPSLRALGALGLGGLGDKRAVRDLTKVARAQDAGPLARAAAAHALGALGARSEASVLAELADATDATLRATALIALARVNGDGARRRDRAGAGQPRPGAAQGRRRGRAGVDDGQGGQRR